MSYLEIKNLTKKYGETEVLKGIDLNMEKGEVVSVIGSSGSGKTTLLRCINFLEFPDTGKMVLNGTTLLNCDENIKYGYNELREKRLNFGLVFQSFNLFPQYSVFENVVLAPELLLKERYNEFKKTEKDKTVRMEFIKSEKAKITAEAEDLLKKTGLSEKRNSYPCELSGGQCQRVAIARALALKPRILCFDEPTSALDPELTGEVLNVIKSLKDENRTMIIVTHEMGFAKNISDRVVFMADGVICEEGTPQNLFSNPQTEKLKSFLKNVNDKDGE
ncbi:MAG: amino acid ABC transporter ATP-binding protein [Clostridia bacterium]|nr:amino acid ABC transporter ATP-binding protein [Clostridia bacterium]